MEKPINSNQEMGLKIGPIVLMPDIEKRHLATLFFGAFFGIASMAFVNVFNYSIFSAMELPEDQFGRLAGSLTAVQEVVVVSVIGFFGEISVYEDEVEVISEVLHKQG